MSFRSMVEPGPEAPGSDETAQNRHYPTHRSPTPTSNPTQPQILHRMPEPPTQGPRAGSNYPPETTTYTDPNSGATVRRLTSYPGQTDLHLYPTTDGWYDDGRRLLFRSFRAGSRQLFSIDLESGLITQVTDVEGFGGSTKVDADAGEAYFWVDDQLVALDLSSLRVRDVVYEVPEGWRRGTLDVAADGSRFYVTISEPVDLPGERSGFVERAAADAETRLLAVPADGGDPEVVFEAEGWWGTHVDASPTRPELVMHVLQGPWRDIEDKIWVQDAETGERWSVRPTPGPDGVGHQHWLADGERVGYHGHEGRWREDDDADYFYGHARYDGTDRVETEIPLRHTHAHTLTPDAFVIDGSPDVPHPLLYRWDEEAEEYDGPRVLATHDWGPDSPDPHSRFSPDGERVLFDSNRYDGSGNLYLVEIPDFEDLPEFEG